MKSTLIALALLSASVIAQPTKAPPVPASPTPNFCDVTYAMATETADNLDVATVVTTLRAIPWVDVQDNHQKNMVVLSALSKEQDKGGPYTVTVTETNTCDGGATVRISDGSAEVQGVTLDGSNRVARVGLQQLDKIIKRYEDRAKAGAQSAWNHKNAKKVKRNDLGQRVDN